MATIEEEAPQPEFKMPKLEAKMLLFPFLMIATRQIDFKDTNNIELARKVLYGVLAVVLSVYFILYQFVERKKEKKQIWVPPKAAAALPFGPQPAAPKPADFTKTTVHDHEIKLIKDALTALGMSAVMAVVMSFKFNIHASLVMQAVMLPVNIFDVPVFSKYILGYKTKGDGTPLYGELTEAPVASIADEDDTTPRVEELAEDEAVPVTTSKVEDIDE